MNLFFICNRLDSFRLICVIWSGLENLWRTRLKKFFIRFKVRVPMLGDQLFSVVSQVAIFGAGKKSIGLMPYAHSAILTLLERMVKVAVVSRVLKFWLKK
jgi:hypothetical protein